MLFLKALFHTIGRKDTPLKLPLSRPIADAFTEHINNEIPTRFIDTSTMHFVSRKDIFRVFQDDIASVTEEQIKERMEGSQSNPLATYQPRRETILRQIIQEIVKYVVLSHRWDVVSGEPCYQDMTSGKRRIARFKKLAHFCETARKLGYRLAWVDTCCIEKTNAAELSEAIHAMYKWYANASLCIVYLAESTSCTDWPREPWFTRGWTLQELLAPRQLKFYNRNWQPFTTSGVTDDRLSEDDIVPHLVSVTGIARTVLTADNSYGVQDQTFWEIMSWASRRQTTRIEDRAYSLVGLLHVTTIVAYGEGNRAFSRLVEIIVSNRPSWDIFVWFGQPSTDHFALPLSPASYPRFDPHMARERTGAQEITVTPYGLSLKAVPLIPMTICSAVEPKTQGQPFRVTLKQWPDNKSSLGGYGNVIVECGATRLQTIRSARRLSACILNHYGARSRDQAKLVVGVDYVCFLLYSNEGEGDEISWMKLSTDNFLTISCTDPPDFIGQKADPKDNQGAHTGAFCLSLVKTFIQCPPSSV